MIEIILALSFSLLSFLLSYGLLNKAKIFERSVNLIISVVISIFVLSVFYYYYSQIILIFSFLILLSLLIFVFLVAYLSKF